VLAVISSYCANVTTALSIALGDEARAELAANGRIYETFDAPDEQTRNSNAAERLHTLRQCARATSSDDCSVEIVLATSSGRIERISTIGTVMRQDMPLDEAHDIQKIRCDRSLAMANLVS